LAAIKTMTAFGVDIPQIELKNISGAPAIEVALARLDLRRIAGVALCTALQVERKSLLALDAVAARGRHGNLVVSISWEMRKRVLEFAWEVVARFIKHLDGTAHDPWKLLDVQFED
jgi:hypothetical protein